VVVGGEEGEAVGAARLMEALEIEMTAVVEDVAVDGVEGVVEEENRTIS